MSFFNANKNRMRFKKIKKKNSFFTLSLINLDYISQKSKFGIIFTLYCDKNNSIEVGFAEDTKVIQKKLLRSNSVLLDMKRGKKNDLNLLIKTLNELDIRLSSKLSYEYSNSLIRHLSTLGWPVGRSLFKQRKIKKEFSFA